MNKFIFSFILLATFFISCGKDSGTNDPNNPNGNGGEQPTLTLSLTELTFKSAGEENIHHYFQFKLDYYEPKYMV